jgi:hypothetical protein
LAAADSIENIKVALIGAECITKRQKFDCTTMHRPPVIQNTSETQGRLIITLSIDQRMLLENFPLTRIFQQKSDTIPKLPWNYF